VTQSDPCPKCSGSLEFTKGIEVGHVFKLGQKYSEAMQAKYLDENGKDQLMVMGCYGIGVSRVVAACIEQNHDEYGIIFPPALAPYEVVILNLSPKDEEVSAKADELYELLTSQGLDVILDDRDERPGVKFKDVDLVGFPMQLVVGGKGLGRGVIEAKDRRSGDKGELPVEGFEAAFADWREQVLKGWESAAE
ncbi:MAG: proline--tRNA ligase, partial [Desulfovibrio sp.]